MFEQVTQMSPMLVLAALIAGWLAATLSRGDGHGFVHDAGFGLIGSVGAGTAFWVLVSSEVGMLMMLLIGCGGATLAIAAQRKLWSSLPR
jgi:uncharacterized membrane protein YeaQ/YmgE (transglycosylase-associated protein family)